MLQGGREKSNGSFRVQKRIQGGYQSAQCTGQAKAQQELGGGQDLALPEQPAQLMDLFLRSWIIGSLIRQVAQLM